MIAKYAIALIVVILLAAAFAWAFLPARYLPGNRARHLRLRLHLRLHPGKGFAHWLSLWLRWGRLAVSAPLRPHLAGPSRCGTASSTPASTRCFSAAPTTGTGSKSRSRST